MGKKRAVLYQLCRSGERFEVGDGPIDLSDEESLVLGRGDPHRSRIGKVYVDDPWMSSKHARVFRHEDDVSPATRQRTLLIEDMGSTNGVLVNGEPADVDHRLEHGDILETGRTFWLYFEEDAAFDLPIEPHTFGSWTTWCPRLAHQLARLEKHVEGRRHVFLGGPEGTGKGFLARTIHQLSKRAGRLVHLDCNERRPSHLVVDLFGSADQPGMLRKADMGTLFLENIDVLPEEAQERLAEALKKGGFTPDGKTRRVSCDVRVVASSTVPLDELSADGLVHRRLAEQLGQLNIQLLGLDERRPDLGLLLDEFLARARGAPALSREACRAVLLYPWRLHVKQFARVIECASVLAVGQGRGQDKRGRVELEHLPVEVVGQEALRQMLPAEEQERPPSGQAPVAGDPERTIQRRPSELGKVPLADSIDDEPPRRSARQPLIRPDSSVRPFEDLGVTDEIPQARIQAIDSDDPRLRQLKEQTDATVAQPAPSEETSEEADRVQRLDIESEDEAGIAAGFTPAEPRAALARDHRPPSAYYNLESMERSYASAVDPDLIVDALRRARGNVSGAARYLGKPRATLQRWLREFQLDADDYRDG